MCKRDDLINLGKRELVLNGIGEEFLQFANCCFLCTLLLCLLYFS